MTEIPAKAKGIRTRPSGRVGIRDVARDAGVSVATVSRALANDGYPVSAETREKVLKSVAKLRFVPNDLARSLSQDRTNTIGIIVPNVVNLYYARVVMGVEEVAAQNGISTIFCNTNNNVDKRDDDIRVLMQKRVDGILLCGSATDFERSHVRMALKELPFIVIGRNDHLDCPSIHADNFKAGYQAAQHLIDLGHKEIVFLSGPRSWSDGTDRIGGFKACLAANGLPFSDSQLIFGEFTEQDAYQRMLDLGRGAKRFTAMIGANDRVAIGAMAALTDLGLSIPDDVAVIGFDNIATGLFVRPSLSTMDIPAQSMGAEGMRLLMKVQNGERVPSRTVFDAPLLIRQSTCGRSSASEAARSDLGS